MSFTFRLCVANGILFIGIQVVYFGMKLNGNASQRNPTWNFVSGIHSIFTYGTLVILFLVAALPIFLALLSTNKREKLEGAEMPLIESESNESLKNESPSQLATEICKDDENANDLKTRKVEVQREKQIIERRRNRSAEEVARSALDDFL